ncbi:methionyl-tRNA formyltransferase [Flavobacterium pallidum]|uniref:Formyl transferase n=1 Tax=Flavobacterium pallidum TaxID=2172098 RepID=A0A2S1SDH8_9FLAO|nr:methionyl-tRNA formyltransferase [Flavobacterium pallidum]AWI24458.1 formyl transferase [Flavobacterium pallidum]
MKIGILASGGLGLKVLQQCSDLLDPVFIAADSKSDGIIDFAKEKQIPLFTGNPRNGRLLSFLNENSLSCDLLFSINYLFLIEQDILDAIPSCINFHGSLLPKYRGRTPHVWAIINNESVTGITAHFIDDQCDTGNIVLQKQIMIGPEMTGAEVLAQYETYYPIMIREIYEKIQNGSLSVTVQDHSKATYFGKRTPEDGQIDWNWQKERIKNWVRAQAHPYPGAFTFLDGQKITIDKVTFSDFGFDSSMENGTILQTDPAVLVKTQNGVIELTQIRENKDFLKQDKILR